MAAHTWAAACGRARALLLAAVASAVAAPPLAPAPAFQCGALTVDASLSYALASPATPSSPWLDAGDTAVHVSGAWYSASSGSLVELSRRATNGTDARRGAWSALAVEWRASDAAATPVTSSFRCYPATGVVSFSLTFPAGASRIATSTCPPLAADVMYNASRAPSARFPSFRADTGSPLESLSFVEWLGDWAFEQNFVGANVSAAFRGGQASGPLVLFDPARGGAAAAALVLSPAKNFRSTIIAPVSGARGAELAAGPQGYLAALPAGWSMEVIAVASAAGVTDAVARWGDALQRAYATVRLPPERDVWTSRLTYFT